MADQGFSISWSDVQKVDPLADSFDYKRDLPEYDFVAAASNYALSDSGEIDRLYRDGVDLGAAQSTSGAVDADGEWIWESASDKLTVNCTNAANTYRWQAAQDTEANMKTKDLNDACEWGISILADRFPGTFEKRDLSFGNMAYDYLFVRLICLLAAYKRRSACDPGSEATADFKAQLWNEDGTGLVDQIKAGEVKFSFEITESDKQGEIVEVTTDSTTTGYPFDTYGTATELFGRYRITIGTGGTISFGTTPSVTYAVTDADGATVVGDTLIDMPGYNVVGGGISVRFADGIYVAADAWDVYARGAPSKTTVIGTIDLVRK